MTRETIDVKVENIAQALLHEAEAAIPKKLISGQWIAEPTQRNTMSYKGAWAEARRMSFVSTTPITKVWFTIEILNKKIPFTLITTLHINTIIYDDPVDIANASMQFLVT